MGKGAVNEQVTFFVQQFGRHRGQSPAVKQVHKERLKNIIAVVAKDHGATPFFTRNSV